MPKISIITPTRNRPDFLKRCIKSVQNQTFEDYEHIIIADNCNYTEKVYNQFKDDSRIVLLKNNTTLFHGGSRKGGLEYSSGKYVTYLDDDDIILPQHLEKLYNEIIIDNTCDIVWSQMTTLSYINIIEGLANFDYILKRNIYDDSGDGNNIQITKDYHQSFLNSLQKRDLINKFGGWRDARNSDGIIIQEMLKNKEDGEIVSWNNLEKLHEINTEKILGFKFRKIEDITCIYNSYGGSSNLSKNAKKDYLNRLDKLKDNQIYCYDEIKKEWYFNDMHIEPILVANECNTKRIIESGKQKEYVLMVKREDNSLYFIKKDLLTKRIKK